MKRNGTQNNSLNEIRFTSDIFSVAELPLSGFAQDDHQTHSSVPFIPVVSTVTCFSKGDTVFVIVTGLDTSLESNWLCRNRFLGFQFKNNIWDKLQCLDIFQLLYLRQKCLVQTLLLIILPSSSDKDQFGPWRVYELKFNFA